MTSLSKASGGEVERIPGLGLAHVCVSIVSKVGAPLKLESITGFSGKVVVQPLTKSECIESEYD